MDFNSPHHSSPPRPLSYTGRLPPSHLCSSSSCSCSFSSPPFLFITFNPIYAYLQPDDSLLAAFTNKRRLIRRDHVQSRRYTISILLLLTRIYICRLASRNKCHPSELGCHYICPALPRHTDIPQRPLRLHLLDHLRVLALCTGHHKRR